MTLNGQFYLIDETITISELLSQAGFDLDRVAVLLNGEIVTKESFGRVEIGGEDALEVVAFVGGG